MRILTLRCDICKIECAHLYLLKLCLLDENGQESKLGLKQEVCRDCNDDIQTMMKHWLRTGKVS